jgi:hypothetical protein
MHCTLGIILDIKYTAKMRIVNINFLKITTPKLKFLQFFVTHKNICLEYNAHKMRYTLCVCDHKN